MVENLQNWSNSLKLVQGGFLTTMVVYLLIFSNGGFFTAYYAWMLAIVGGLIATIASLVQRNILMIGIDISLMALLFLHFIRMA